MHVCCFVCAVSIFFLYRVGSFAQIAIFLLFLWGVYLGTEGKCLEVGGWIRVLFACIRVLFAC